MLLITICFICKPGSCVLCVKQQAVWVMERPVQGQKQSWTNDSSIKWPLTTLKYIMLLFCIGPVTLSCTNIVDDHGIVHVMQNPNTKQCHVFARHHARQKCCSHFHVLCTCTSLPLEMLLDTPQREPCRPCDLISRDRCKAICGRTRILELCCCLSQTAWPACFYG